LAPSTIGPTVYPLAASASGPGTVAGPNLGSASASSSTATAASPGSNPIRPRSIRLPTIWRT
jgi:hypothetical protein